MVRPIPEFPGYYASDAGQIWSCNRGLGRWLSQSTDRVGRKSVTLRYGRRQYTRLVHRLVLEAFVGPRPEGMECCHNNGDPADNRLKNLRWDTRSANNKDKVRHGRCPLSGSGISRPKGEQHPRAKLRSLDVRWIRYLRKAGISVKDLAEYYPVTQTMIRYICNRTFWKHI